MIMYKDVLSNEWKSFTRRPDAGNAIVTNVIYLFLYLFLGSILAFIGYFLPLVLKQTQPLLSPLTAANHLIASYLCIDLMMRFFLKNLPTGIIQSYFLLNVRKQFIAHYVILKSLFSLLTFAGFILWGAFSISCHDAGILWFLLIALLLLINSFVITLLKSFVKIGIKEIFIVIAFIGCLAAAQYLGYLSIGTIISVLLNHALQQPLYFLIPIGILAALIFITSRTIIKLINRETTTGQKRILKSRQPTITLFSFEWKQFWRNKQTRTRVFVITGGGLYFMITALRNIDARLIVQTSQIMALSIFTMFVSINFLGAAFSLVSTFFDKLSTIPFSWKSFLIRKIFLSALVLIPFFIISLAMGILLSNFRVLIWIITFIIFHLGVSYHFALYQSTYNVIRNDGESSSLKNRPDKSYTPWYIGGGMIAYMVLVPAVAILLNYFLSTLAAQIIFFSIGVLGLFFMRHTIEFTYRAFLKRRYTMMEGFRKSV